MFYKYADGRLCRAAARGDAKTIRKLLRSGADAGDTDNAAMRRALRHGHAAVVRSLVKAGADFRPNTQEFFNLAAQNRNAQSLKILLRSINAIIPQDVLNPSLYTAIKARNTQAVAVLVAAGANPKGSENPPARLAAAAGSVPILRILRQHGADFDVRDGGILGNAVSERHLVATIYILASGAQVNSHAHMAVTSALVLGIRKCSKRCSKLAGPCNIHT